MASMFLFFFIFSFHFYLDAAQQSILQTYIIRVNLPEGHDFPGGSLALESWYGSFLDGIQDLNTNTTPSRMVYMYRNVITGFAAKLYPHEVEEMEKKEGFLHAMLQEKYDLHTTRSSNFLGLYQDVGAWPDSNYGKGVIIGVVDSGVTPGHPSFSGENVPPPPVKWKGKCELKNISCNNKLIGARNFASDDPGPPVDYDGHGTHIASIAAGNFVLDANMFGQANGTASGMAPLAHLAIYKACGNHCHSSDILAAMDAAIEDGVDVLSVSLGKEIVEFYRDVIALGAFSAMKKGIFVSCSGGNKFKGPNKFQVSNGAPWILTVGASTIDRKIVARVLLGNKEDFEGQTLFQPENYHPSFLTIIYPGISGDEKSQNASLCLPGALDDIDVTGKLVVCDIGGPINHLEKGRVVRDAGGAGMILVNEKIDGYTTFADPFVLPAVDITHASGERIKSYINSTMYPIATILFKGTVIGDKTAPSVPFFSSRGPNLASRGILKPDIIGPGLNILAAWPESGEKNNNEQASFNMISGTSMSCSHLSGIAALIKNSHPDWSPAMIKSAIMTSAEQTNLNKSSILDEETNETADVFAIGAGHVNATRALDPGLVYDISTNDYISYLCNIYTEKQVAIIVQRKINCRASEYKRLPEAALNYPSVSLELSSFGVGVYSRTVTNVGDANSDYRVKIEGVSGVNVNVFPNELKFTKVGERYTYWIFFTRFWFQRIESYVEGSITWVSPKHSVRIPVSVKLVPWKTKLYLSG
ncbi:subtilisin-like protease [Primulina eburnea]|uniref:subtilisin-like protease n=1 Tax=Primulina eburnea TaxID=1245227 RepID=UPI003C6C03FF